MAKIEDVNLGDRWAHRAHGRNESDEVEVVAVSTSPRRVEVEFVAAATRAWVSPARLEVLWDERDVFYELQEKWHELSTFPDEIESWAVDVVFDILLRNSASTNWVKQKQGTIAIRDEERVDAIIGGDLKGVTAGAAFIVDSDGTHYGWGVAVAIARNAAHTHPQRVMAYVHAEERDAKRARSAVHDTSTRPLMATLREWCGEDVVSAEDERMGMLEEASRVAELFQTALAMLSMAGKTEDAWLLHKRFDPSASKREWKARVARELERSKLR